MEKKKRSQHTKFVMTEGERNIIQQQL